MGMLKSIRIQNFKCFEDSANIEIKPLTILCGINSSGKSSILKSLLMLKQSYENIQVTNSATLNGKYTNNGSMNDVIYNQKGDTFSVTTSFVFHEPPVYKKGSNLRLDKQNIAVFKELAKLLKLGKFPGEIFMSVALEIANIEEMNTSSNVIKRIEVGINSSSMKPLKIILQKSRDMSNRDYTIELYNFINTKDNIETDNIEFLKLDGCACYFEGMKLVNIYKENWKYANIFSDIYSIMRCVARAYSSIKHISPLRVEPSRYNIYDEECLNIGENGENVVQVIESMKKRIINVISPPINDRLSIAQKTFNFYDVFRLWTEYIGIRNITTQVDKELLKLSIDKHNIADTGFGVSQVLPIVVEGLLLQDSQTLLIEQPEIHLHPKMQMNITDFLIASTMGNKNIIIETHSDHIINRVVRRIMEDKSDTLKNRIVIYFIDKDIETGKSKIAGSIEINKYKGIVNAPEEFFSQFASETEKIVSIAFNNLKENNFKFED